MLTEAQKQEIELKAIDMVIEDIVNNDAYLRDIVTAYVRTFSPEDQAALVGAQADHFDFDPRTGQPWPEEDA